MLCTSFLFKWGHINTCLFFFLKGLRVKGQQAPSSMSNQAEQVGNKHLNRPHRPKSPVCLDVHHSLLCVCVWVFVRFLVTNVLDVEIQALLGIKSSLS